MNDIYDFQKYLEKRRRLEEEMNDPEPGNWDVSKDGLWLGSNVRKLRTRKEEFDNVMRKIQERLYGKKREDQRTD